MAKELDCEQTLGWAVENIKLDNRWFKIYFKSKALIFTADNAKLLTTNILEKGWKKTKHVNLVVPDAVSWKLYTHQLILSFVRLGDRYDSFKWSKNIATNYFTARPGYRETFGDEIGEKCLVVKAHLEGQMKTHVYMWLALANKVFLGGTAEMSMARY